MFSFWAAAFSVSSIQKGLAELPARGAGQLEAVDWPEKSPNLLFPLKFIYPIFLTGKIFFGTGTCYPYYNIYTKLCSSKRVVQ